MTDPTQDDVFVYVIGTNRDGQLHAPTKVGISARPFARFSNLQTASPYDLVLVKSFRLPSREIATQMEDCFHVTQKAHRLRGEWFNIDPQIAAQIVTLHLAWAIKLFTGMEGHELSAAYEMVGIPGYEHLHG